MPVLGIKPNPDTSMRGGLSHGYRRKPPLVKAVGSALQIWVAYSRVNCAELLFSSLKNIVRENLNMPNIQIHFRIDLPWSENRVSRVNMNMYANPASYAAAPCGIIRAYTARAFDHSARVCPDRGEDPRTFDFRRETRYYFLHIKS